MADVVIVENVLSRFVRDPVGRGWLNDSEISTECRHVN